MRERTVGFGAARKAGPVTAATVLVVLVALGLRIVAWPQPGSVPQSDEIGYLTDGLLLLEGIPAGYKHSPNALTAWISAAYAAGLGLLATIDLSIDAGLPLTIAAVSGFERAVFTVYSDFSALRNLIASITVALFVVAALSCSYAAWRRGGAVPALLAGMLVASLPAFVEFSVQTRPYGMAWALALIALSISAVRPGALAAAIVFGLAASCRIEMAVLLVLFAADNARLPENVRLRAALRFVAVAVAAGLLAAPWYLTSLLGNLRQIVTVRLLSGDGGGPEALFELLSNQGLVAAALLSLVAAAGARSWWERAGFAFALLIVFASALSPSGHGIRHNGPFLVAMCWMAPIGLAEIGRWVAAAPWRAVLAACAALPPIYAGSATAATFGRSADYGAAIDWVENNVPEGQTIYFSPEARTLLPTAASGEILWEQVANAQAWQTKIAAAARRYGVGFHVYPRFMSDDHVNLDRSLRRRYFILAQPHAPGRRRYDLQIVSYGSIFDVTIEQAIKRACADGATVVHRGALPALGQPEASWTDRERGLHVYVVEAGSCE